ncbi:MAG: DUF1015 domain-containing protein [Candidatus Omnitrophota bacterium]
MTEIAPFQAVLYNQERIKDLSSVACPPYDVISSLQQKYYYELDPYNLIHILLGKDISGEDKYQRADRTFKDWLKEKVLIQDQKPAVYFYFQEYRIRGEKKARMGFIGRLFLEEKKASIFTHEHTRLEPKEDRLKLLRAVRANLSPIFVIFPDKRRTINMLYKHVSANQPFINIEDKEGITHKLWRITDVAVLSKLKGDMRQASIFIADGHHRYEVARAFREEIRKEAGDLAHDASANYILTYFTSAESQGLTILPIHRLVTLNNGPEITSVISSLKDYFEVEEIKDKARLFFLMEKAGSNEHVFGLYHGGQYWFLRFRNKGKSEKLFKSQPDCLRLLDVSLLNNLVFYKILQLDIQDERLITYSNNPDELIRQAQADTLKLAFFLNPVKVAQITSVALAGERMPAKSSYFYPKVLSGLVVNKHED